MYSTSYASAATLIGRILIAAFFIPSGLQKIADFTGTAGYIASVGLPAPELGAVIAIVMEVAVAGMLLLGWKARWAALALAVFCLVAAAPSPVACSSCTRSDRADIRWTRDRTQPRASTLNQEAVRSSFRPCRSEEHKPVISHGHFACDW